MANKSTLNLGYVIMSDEGRFLVEGSNWGAIEGNDMYDAHVYRSRARANKIKNKLSPNGDVFEIGKMGSL